MTIKTFVQSTACVVLSAFVLLLSGLSVSDANAQDEPILWTADDPELEWGPCPEFMPEGCGIAVLQGDPEEPNADVFFRMAPDTTVPNHWHTSAERMVLVSGELHVVYEGHDPVVMRPGSYAYGPAELPHETHCVGDDDCVLFIAFEEPVDAHPHD